MGLTAFLKSRKIILLLVVLVVLIFLFSVLTLLFYPEILENKKSKESSTTTTAQIKTYGIVTTIDKDNKVVGILDSQTSKKYKIKITSDTKILQNKQKIGFDQIVATSITVLSDQPLVLDKENQVKEIWIAPVAKAL